MTNEKINEFRKSIADIESKLNRVRKDFPEDFYKQDEFKTLKSQKSEIEGRLEYAEAEAKARLQTIICTLLSNTECTIKESLEILDGIKDEILKNTKVGIMCINVEGKQRVPSISIEWKDACPKD